MAWVCDQGLLMLFSEVKEALALWFAHILNGKKRIKHQLLCAEFYSNLAKPALTLGGPFLLLHVLFLNYEKSSERIFDGLCRPYERCKHCCIHAVTSTLPHLVLQRQPMWMSESSCVLEYFIHLQRWPRLRNSSDFMFITQGIWIFYCVIWYSIREGGGIQGKTNKCFSL